MTLDAKYIASNLSACANVNLLRNSEFNDDSVWTIGIEGGNAWTFSGGVITVSLPGVFDSTHPLDQNISGSVAGTYLLLSQWTLSNISGDTAQIRFFFYDEDDNLLWTPGLQPIPLISYYDEQSSNGTFELRYEFTTLVRVARIRMYALVWSGSSINISVPFIKLYSNEPMTPMNQDGPINVNVTTCLVEDEGIFDDSFDSTFE